MNEYLMNETNSITYMLCSEQVASNAHAEPGGKYTATGDLQSIHYTLDHMGRIYSIVTNPSFSVRNAFVILEEFQQSFQRDFGGRLSTASEESLSRVSTPMLRDFCRKYVIDVVLTVLNRKITPLYP